MTVFVNTNWTKMYCFWPTQNLHKCILNGHKFPHSWLAFTIILFFYFNQKVYEGNDFRFNMALCSPKVTGSSMFSKKMCPKKNFRPNFLSFSDKVSRTKPSVVLTFVYEVIVYHQILVSVFSREINKDVSLNTF